MNIFYLSPNPAICSQWYHDVHLNKMLLESCQIMATVRHGAGMAAPYKPTHRNHPSVIWAGANQLQYNWVQQLAYELYREWQFRFNKPHACFVAWQAMYTAIPFLEFFPWQDPPQVMPEVYRGPDCATAYRRYYIVEKLNQSRPATWTGRDLPTFISEALNND